MDSLPATKADLNDLEKRFDEKLEKLEQKLDQKLTNFVTKEDLANALAKFPTAEDVARHFNVALEQMRIFIATLDDRHTHKSDELRRDLDAHRSDTALHRAPRRRKASGS